MNDKLKDTLTKALFDLQGQQGYLNLEQTAALYFLTGFPVPAGTQVALLIKEFQSEPAKPQTPPQGGPLQVGDKVRIVSHDDPPEEFKLHGWLPDETRAFPIGSTAAIIAHYRGYEPLFNIQNDSLDEATCIYKTCLERIEE